MTTACNNAHGVRIVMLGFAPCNGDAQIKPVAHSLFGDEMPMWDLVNYKRESMPGRSGRQKMTDKPMKGSFTVERLQWIPLSYYQGDAAITGYVEYINGDVYAFKLVIPSGDEMSDGHSVKITIDTETITHRSYQTAPAA
jgi:hypothetical protein